MNLSLHTTLAAIALAFTTISQAQTGTWAAGPRGSSHDLVPDAVITGSMNIGGRTAPATIFFACSGGQSGAERNLELRFLTSSYSGFAGSDTGIRASLRAGERETAVSVKAYPVSPNVIFISPASPDIVRQLSAASGGAQREIRLAITAGAAPVAIRANAGQPDAPFDDVLRACGATVPAEPAATAVAASPVPAPSSAGGEAISCPVKAGLQINVVEVMINGKKMDQTDGDDISIDWTLPPANSRHQAILRCGYARKGSSTMNIAAGNWISLPIPSETSTCSFTQHDPNKATCLR